MSELEIPLVRCNSCQTVQVPPRWVCTKCGEKDFTRVSGEISGTVYSYTTIHVAPARFREQVPYVVALVELPYGVKVTARLDCQSPQEVVIGMPVVLSKREDGCLWFRLTGKKES